MSNCISQFGLYDGALRAFRAIYYRSRYGHALHFSDAIGLLERPVDEWHTHLPHNEQHQLVLPTLSQKRRAIEEDKLQFAARCVAAGIDHPRALAVIGSAILERAPGGSLPIESAQELARFVESNEGLQCICKPVSGGQGYGVHDLKVEQGQIVALRKTQSAEAYFNELRSMPYRRFEWLIQERVAVHPYLQDLMPGPGVGTVRVISVLKKDDSVELRWPVLKLPAPGSVVDNWRFGTGGATVAAIDPASGSLARVRGRPPGRVCCDWLDTFGSPPTAIVGRVLPCWRALVALVEQAATAFPELPILGWDVAITPNGPVVIEANWDFTILLQSVLERRGLRADFMDLLALSRDPTDYVPERRPIN